MQLLGNTTSPFARIVRIALIEKGLDATQTVVDPWGEDPRLLAANITSRVPALVLDDGTALTESGLILQWIEHTRPAPQWPSVIVGSHGGDAAKVAGILSRAGMAMGAIEGAISTLISRKISAPVLFDETPVGLRRRRGMVENMQKLDAQATAFARSGTPTIDVINTVTLYDYQQLRFGDQAWLPKTPGLKDLAEHWNQRPSFAQTKPFVPAA